LAPKDKRKLLSDLKKNKRNRTVGEAQDLLALFGFEYRAASKEQGGVWKRGSYTLTLPMPHGRGDKSLPPAYVSMIIRVIELAEEHDAKDKEAHELDKRP
jgi:hypothetical protein